jgi:hypothetical protein
MPSRNTNSAVGMEWEKYWAFISYSHVDEPWAKWLHASLETYRVGRDGRPTVRRICPVFRDREELPGSADLGATIRKAF